MAMMIGHASIDENGNISGGKAGDQTKKEVCIRTCYMHSKGWYLFRFINPEHANLMAKAMTQACNNDNIGYDQNQRLGVMTALKKYGSLKKIAEPTECDCSSLIRACIYQATGIDVGNFTTATQPTVLSKSGLFEPMISVTSITKTYDGDILVTQKKGHTVSIVSGNPRTISEKKGTFKMDTLKKGSNNNDVTVFEVLMKKLGYYKGEIDTEFGNGCVNACNEFQKKYPECGTNGKPDSTFGNKCWKKLFSLAE